MKISHKKICLNGWLKNNGKMELAGRKFMKDYSETDTEKLRLGTCLTSTAILRKVRINGFKSVPKTLENDGLFLQGSCACNYSILICAYYQ
jgi:hypothetical protein